jgi:hypothetical protein
MLVRNLTRQTTISALFVRLNPTVSGRRVLEPGAGLEAPTYAAGATTPNQVASAC